MNHQQRPFKMRSIFNLALAVILVATRRNIFVNSFSPSQKLNNNRQQFSSPIETTQIYYKNERDVDDATLVGASNITKSSAVSRAIVREQVIQSVGSVQDYQELVVGEEEKLVIVRFHAPWCRVSILFVSLYTSLVLFSFYFIFLRRKTACSHETSISPALQVCKATAIAYERLATKLHHHSRSSQKIKFLSVNMDGQAGTNELKELLHIQQVPSGLIYHPSIGVMGRVNLGRANLSELKKRLNAFLEAGGKECDLDDILDGLVEGEDVVEIEV